MDKSNYQGITTKIYKMYALTWSLSLLTSAVVAEGAFSRTFEEEYNTLPLYRPSLARIAQCLYFITLKKSLC